MMDDKPKNGPKNVKIRAEILSDSRLTKTESDIVEIAIKRPNQPSCTDIIRDIDVYTRDCNWGAFEMKVMNVQLALKETHQVRFYDVKNVINKYIG